MARAKAKPKPAEDAGGGAMREEWSCPLCTLLNKWDAAVCGACAQERPEDVAPVPSEWTCGACTLVNEWVDERCAACFQERPPASETSGPASGRQGEGGARAAGRPNGVAVLESSENGAPAETVATPRSSRRASRKRPLSPALPKQEIEARTRPVSRFADSPPTSARQDEAEPDELPAAPTFSLLGFMNPSEHPASPVAPVIPSTRSEPSEFVHAERPSFSLLGESAAIDLTTVPDADPAHETEAKLAQAGLDLSDSDSDDNDRKRHKLRRKSVAKSVVQETKAAVDASSSNTQANGDGAEWDCEVCTEPNAAHLDRCELCNSKRNQLSSVFAASRKPASPPPPAASAPGTAAVECAVCTHMNPRHVDRCELCDIPFEKVQCDVCLHMNPQSFERCELCESLRSNAEPRNSDRTAHNATTRPETKIACPVCTNLNEPHLENCEMCETDLATASRPRRQTARYDFIDLASSQPDDRGHNDSESDGEAEYNPNAESNSDDDFEHIYPSRARSPDYSPSPPYAPSPPPRRQRNRATYDRIEDISDNEMQGGMRSQYQPAPPPRSKRPELTEFQHFLPVEDTRFDYQCKIDYRSMFAESSASRTYNDRLKKRRAESQKRKRTHAQNGLLSEDDAPARRGRAGSKKRTKKASGKKAKTKASPRRASTGTVAAKKAREPKRSAAAKPRRASASAFASGINHYDTASADFGDDVTTMAWEGLGSAGYC